METLQRWKDEYWQLEVDISEVKQNELKRKLEDQLEKEQEKRRRLENEVETLKKANKKLTKQTIYGSSIGRGSSTRTWQSYSRQQQLNKKKKMASELKSTLEICGEQHFKAHSIEVENIDTNKREILDLDTSVYTPQTYG